MVVFAMEENNFVTNGLQSNLTNDKNTNEQNSESSILCKYRSLDACKCALMDIFENKRLYMSSHKAQNDFAEGDYYFENGENINPSEVLNTLKKAKEQYTICSLSEDEKYINRLMWGHYANGGNGIMIRLKLSNELRNNSHFCYRKVTYKDKIKFTEYEIESPTKEVVEKILFNKHTVWKYENEYRVLANFDTGYGQVCNYCPIEKIEEVVVGPSIKTEGNPLLEKLKEKYGGKITFTPFEEKYKLQ